MYFLFLSFFKIFIIIQSFATDAVDYFEIDLKNLKAVKTNNLLVGNISNGKKLFVSRKVNCLSCHTAPIDEEKFQGNFGPPLKKIGFTYSKDELRLRIINPKLINPNTIMPAYYVKVKNPRTPKKYFNRTILIAQEVEDLVEYLHSLK